MARPIMLVLTLLLSGRAMTLPFIMRAGGSLPGDPPAAWLMPLVGDAVIGLSALAVAWALWRRAGLWVWISVVVWNAVAIWDALAAWLVQTTTPWDDFFMLRYVGEPMFAATCLMHGAILLLASRPGVRSEIVG